MFVRSERIGSTTNLYFMTLYKELQAELNELPAPPFTITRLNADGSAVGNRLFTVTEKRINDSCTGIEFYVSEDGFYHDWFPADIQINTHFRPN